MTATMSPASPMTALLRSATREDIAELATLKRGVAAAAYADAAGDQLALWLDAHCGEAFFAYRIGRKAYRVIVAEIDGVIVGFTGYRVRGNRADGNSVGLYVSVQGRGIGAALQAERQLLASAEGCTVMRTSVWRTNAGSRRFVERAGFERMRAFREPLTGIMVDHFECTL